MSIPRLALPHGQYRPFFPKNLTLLLVAFDVPHSLTLPELCIRLGNNSSIRALVHVPEATVNEDDGPMFRENDVRASRQIADVQPVPISERVEKSPDLHLRAGVLPLDA